MHTSADQGIRTANGLGRDDGSLRTYAWVCSTGGALSRAQRRQLLRPILREYAGFVAGLVTLPWAQRRAPQPAPPLAVDSAMAHAADDAAMSQPPALIGHGYRTWLFGGALAHLDAIDLDPELFYVGALLHDAGIAKSIMGEDFTIRSARCALATLDSAGVEIDPDRRRTLADAIVGHATPGMSASMDPLATYIQAGALLDLAGLRVWHLPAPFIRDVYRQHPEPGTRAIVGMIRGEKSAVPRGRFALLSSTGLPLAMRLAPTRFYR